MLSEQWVQFLSIATNISVLVLGIRLIRNYTKMEFRVNMMWRVFEKRFGPVREDNHESDFDLDIEES